MTEAHKLGRILAERAAMNGKCTAYLDSKLQVKQSHNFTADYIEKMVYSKETKKVTIHDKKGKEIKGTVKSKNKDKAPSKLSNASNEKSS